MFSIRVTDEAFLQVRRVIQQFPSRKGEVAQALKMIKSKLGSDPLGCSESREDQNRICIQQPLSLFFTVDFEHDVVVITQLFFNPKP